MLRLAKRLSSIAFLVYLCGFVGFVVYDFAVNGPKAARMQPVLVQEFQQVPPFPGATVVEHDAVTKPGSVLVSASYQTAADAPAIRAYYAAALAAQGWHFFREEPMMVGYLRTHQDGETTIYCRPGQEADLDEVATPASYGWAYGFSVGWGGAVTACPRPPAPRWQAPAVSALLGLLGLALLAFGLTLAGNRFGLADQFAAAARQRRHPLSAWLPGRRAAPAAVAYRLMGVSIALLGLFPLSFAVLRGVPALDSYAEPWLAALFGAAALGLVVAAVADAVGGPRSGGG